MENNGSNNKDKMALLNIQSPDKLLTLKRNNSFCDRFFRKNNIATVVGDFNDFNESRELVYDLSRVNGFESEAFNKIIDLLMQLRATDKDQSILVHNNTILREQILNQLKNEVLRVGHKLTNNQIKNLEVISSNTFDEKTLAQILKSLIESSKKKLEGKQENVDGVNTRNVFRYSTLQRTSKDYLTILNKTKYYENVVDRVLKNVYHDHLIYRNEEPESNQVHPEETAKKEHVKIHKYLKESDNKKTNISDIEILEEASKYYENNIINKSILPKIIKLQSKISEFNILTKVGSFVEDVIKESVPKILVSKTELINKIIDKSEIKELRENIVEHQQQYVNDKTYYDRNISRVYNEVRKFYNSKNISKNIVDVLKTTKIKNLNLEENIKKNVIKIATRKDILNRFKNVYERNTQKESDNHVINRVELVNRYKQQELSNEDVETIKDVTNLRKSGITINKTFSENVRQNNILEESLRLRKKKLKRIHKSFDKITDIFEEEKVHKNSSIDFDVIKRKYLTRNNVEDYFYKCRNIYRNKVDNNLILRSDRKTYEFIQKEINDKVTELNEKQVKEKISKVLNKEILNVVKREIKPSVVTEYNTITGQPEVRAFDLYKYSPVYRREKIFEKGEFKSAVLKNITRVLSPYIVRNKEIKVNTENIYRDYKKNFVDRYVENFYDTKKEYLSDSKYGIDKKSFYNHFENDYMVYKEKYVPESNVRKDKIQRKPDLKHTQRVDKSDRSIDKPITIDTKSIEKNILAKTLSKKDVMNMIQSCMENINVDSISNEVVGRVERKLMMDRRRRGFF